jgi:hypothetical protein
MMADNRHGGRMNNGANGAIMVMLAKNNGSNNNGMLSAK